MKRTWISVLALGLVSASCGRPAPEPADASDQLEASSVTMWSEKTELFAEYPPLVVGETSRFAIHLTRLDSFRALTEGHVEVRLTGADGSPESFQVDAPSRPGIFGIDVRPARAGRRELAIVVRHPALADQHLVGPVTVHADVSAARAATATVERAGDEISFLKEQQWVMDFGTAAVVEASVRESVRVPAQIAPRPGGSADVTAPIDGRLVRVTELQVGASVAAGDEMARVQPPPSAPGDLPQLQQAVAEAATLLRLAMRDRERAERLVMAGAAPERRLEDARAAEEQARARAAGAEARLAQYQDVRTATSSTSEGNWFVLRAPVAGVVAERAATVGANVAAGTVLFRVTDPRLVQVVGQIPEASLARGRQARAAELELPGSSTRVAVGPLAGLGRVLDPRTRTVPITFALDNGSLGLVVGQSVYLHLLAGETPPRPVVPASAIVDDAGRPIVFVQTEGESFERRAVTLGPRSGDVVQVIDGVKTGERVVTRGAYLVRLASLSTQVPAHGHVH
jgi:cobalt-zinc-cadmium efflux system membrane fusion protein